MDLSGLELELGTTQGRAFRSARCDRGAEQERAPETDYTYVLMIARRRSIFSP